MVRTGFAPRLRRVASNDVDRVVEDLLRDIRDARAAGDRHGEERLLARMVEADPGDLGARLHLLRIRFRLGNVVEFERGVDDCLEEAARPRRRVPPPPVEIFLWTFHVSPDASRLDDRLRRLTSIVERALRLDPQSPALRAGLCRVLLARRDRRAFLAAAEALPTTNAGPRHAGRIGVDGAATRMPTAGLGSVLAELRTVATRWADPAHPDRSAPKVFGIGLSRTGTSSLHAALGILGFTSLHWKNHLTMDLIRSEDIPLFDAFSDTGITARFEELSAMYPAARFVWTTRPVDDWGRSVRDHYGRQLGVQQPGELLHPPVADSFRGLKGRIEASVYGHHATWEEAYAAHARRVEHFFADKAPDRLLRTSLTGGDGWAPLCRFLDRPIPDRPFPHANRRPSATGSSATSRAAP